MNKTFIIFQHELLKTLRRTGFIILTLALPLLALLGIAIFQIASGAAKPVQTVTQIGFVDDAGSFNQFVTQGNVKFVPFNTVGDATRALVNKDVTAYFVVPRDFISTGTINLYSTQQMLEPPGQTVAALKNFIVENLLSGHVPSSTITRIETPVNIVPVTLTSTGAPATQQGSYANVIIPGIFSFLLALSLMFSAIYVLQSLSEEKENRLMEILLSSVSTRQLLTGKVLGLGAAGLIQVIVWVISLPLLLNLASSSIGGILSTIHVPANFWLLGVIYFILGYSVFAVLSAGIAAITSSLQEAQALSGIYTLFNIAPFWFFSLLLIFPNSPVWIVFTIFPFSAPVLTMIRLGVTGVPVWQLALSCAVLILTIIGGLLLDSKLLRAYMLMYGKRPGLGTIIRTLRRA